MTRLYKEDLAETRERITFDSENAHIVRDVLRFKPGDEVDMIDGKGLTVRVRIRALSKKVCEAEVVGQHRNDPLRLNVTLLQGIPKGEKSSAIVQKAVEWGIV